MRNYNIDNKNIKIAQCRYCTNSSNEGDGIWLDNRLWICFPCINKIDKQREKKKHGKN